MKEFNVCAAPGCTNKFKKNSPHHKYCSKTCRFRANKQVKYKERIEQGLCPQCGKEMENITDPYCNSCSEYFKSRYYANKKDAHQ